MPKNSPEQHEQRQLVKWLEQQKLYGRVLHFTSVNSMPFADSYFKINMLKSSGLRKGFPDMIVLLKEYLVFIELKRPKKFKVNGELGNSPSKVSEEQYEWIRLLNGYPSCKALICYGALDAIKYLSNLIGDAKIPKETQQKTNQRIHEFDDFIDGKS